MGSSLLRGSTVFRRLQGRSNNISRRWIDCLSIRVKRAIGVPLSTLPTTLTPSTTKSTKWTTPDSSQFKPTTKIPLTHPNRTPPCLTKCCPTPSQHKELRPKRCQHSLSNRTLTSSSRTKSNFQTPKTFLKIKMSNRKMGNLGLKMI